MSTEDLFSEASVATAESSVVIEGSLRKMTTRHEPEAEGINVHYQLLVESEQGEQAVELGQYLGKTISLSYVGKINCQHCGRKTNKSFSQGYCYPCFKSLARCDVCMVSPEKCHFEQGSCREPEWAQGFCMSDHIVYLANSSKPKVGITRVTQMPTRWMDQGAVSALPIFRVATRQISGLLEDGLKEFIGDKTNWRAMLKGDVPDVDLLALAEDIKVQGREIIDELQEHFGLQAVTELFDVEPLHFSYPILEAPTKVTSLNFDKTPEVSGVLKGIKGQYLILDTGVINLRKFSGYNIRFTA